MAMKVLLPIDRTRNSLAAEEYAIKFHKQMPLEVTLLHVINEKKLHDRGIGKDLMEMVIQRARDHGATVLKQASDLLKKAGMEHSMQIEYGHPGPVICRTAAEGDFDMVIINESGYSELGELLVGSVVSYVTHHCRVPVLVLKHEKE